MTSPPPELTPLQKAALAVKALRERVDALEQAASLPIAVVGVGCRLPAGGDGPEAFWEAIATGRNGSRVVPADRWDIERFYDPQPGVPGKMYVKNGCFIDGVDRFDPLFFRISPREAVAIDPQQRLLLEVTWEALENAGIAPPSLLGSRTGVFLGISTNDYSAILGRTAHGSGSNATAGAGNAASVASGRISYTFGFQGPCLAVDTACSSSLVAAHLAVQALRNGECRLAIVAGVNLMLSPEITINFCQGRMLSPDGLCKTFDAGADGYARGEGCGVLVLKPLADAIAEGHRILAVIRGSAVNQDGRSAGLTAPNGLAQEAVIRQALANARLTPQDIDYIEAHGTGTSLGDPIEMQALRTVFAEGRDWPLYVGSVKTNIGHAEAAAGVSGLIKAALMLSRQTVPPHGNFRSLNPHIDLAGVDFRIPLEASAMALRAVGVSSFGFSGTNAHVVLGPPPEVPAPAAPPNAPAPRLFLSARSPEALRELMARYEEHLADTRDAFADICHTAAVGRARFPWWVQVEHADELATAVPSNAPPPAIPATTGRRVALPTYPFERERYWVDAPAATAPEAGVAIALPAGAHPLLGRRVPMPLSTERRWESRIAASIPGLAFVDEHRVGGEAILPATAFVEMALAAQPGSELSTFRIGAPLPVSGPGARTVHSVLDAAGTIRIVSVAEGDEAGAVVTHAVGELRPGAGAPPRVPEFDDAGEPLSADTLYAALEQRGVVHGPSFRCLDDIRRHREGVSARLRVTAGDSGPWASLHPAVFDAALQAVAVALPDTGATVMLPTHFDAVRVHRRPAEGARVLARARREGAGVRAEVVIADAQGVAIDVGALRFSPAGSALADGGAYRLDWQPAPLLKGLVAPHFLPDATTLAGALAAESPVLGERHGMADYAAAGDALERVATGFVAEALRALGMAFEPGVRFTVAPQAEALGIDERHRRLFERMLAMLADDGVLERSGRAWKIVRAPEPVDARAEFAALAQRHPAMAGEIGLVGRCGVALAEVLTGRRDPLTLLFPAEGEGAGVFYGSSAYARTVNDLLVLAVRRVAATLPPGRTLRILEIGAGTGGATRAVLPAFAGVPFHYTFTDVSTAFLTQAQRELASAPLDTRLLDIERDPEGQGFAGERFDLVLAANVLHATRDLGESLAHIRQLIAPEGLLLLVESTQARRWVDIVFGLTEGWWRFTDTARRPSHPLLSPPQWHAVLSESGFEPGEGPASEVLVARAKPAAPVATGRRWHVSGDGAVALSDALRAAGESIAARHEASDWVHVLPGAGLDLASQQALLESLVSMAREAIASPARPRLTFIATSAPSHSGVAGFARTLAIEHPTLSPRVVVDPASLTAVLDDLVGEMAGEPEVRWSQGERQVARLVPRDDAVRDRGRISGTWLITGGFGGLGIAIGRWLAAQGASHLVLLGRHVPEAVPEMGAPVTAVAGDASDAALVERVVAGLADLEGVVHAAGALADAPVAELGADAIVAVLRAKVGGALAIDRALASRPDVCVVLFASAAGVLGSARQANHAFASTFLDGLACSRAAEGKPWRSLDWGVWSSVGEAARQGFDARASQLGLGVITPERGVAAFGELLAAPGPQWLVLPTVDWPRLAGTLGDRVPPLFAHLAREPVAAIAEPVAPPVPVRDTPATTVAGGDAADTLAAIVAGILRLPATFDRRAPLPELGLDSLVAVEIKNQVAKATGVELSVRELIEGATLEDLAARVREGTGADAVPREAAGSIVPDLANRHEPFALTDMQQAFWVGRRSDLALGSVNCYLYTEFDAHGVDIGRLEAAWNQLVQRHDMLRAVIAPNGRQRILAQVPPYAFEVLDWRDKPAQHLESALLARRETLARRVAEPDAWPLFDIRVTLHGKLARIHLGFDLIAMDAASIFALRHELATLYDDPRAPLPPIGLSFRDYVLRLEAQRLTPEWRDAQRYWQARAASLPEAPALPLVPEAQRPAKPAFRRHRVVIEAADAEALKREAQARGLTLSTTLAAVYADVLAVFSRSPRFCVTVTLFNRPAWHPDMGSLIGDFTSSVLLEVDARGETFADRALSLMRQLAADLDHTAVSGIQVLRDIARATGEGLRTVPVVFTSALGFARPAGTESGLWDRLGTTVHSVSSTPQVWIDHQITEEDGKLFCHWDILEGIFPPGVAEGLVTAYGDLVTALARGPGWSRPLSAEGVACLPRAALSPPPAAPALLQSAFETLARAKPSRIALITADETLDYGTLDLAAAHLAARLAPLLGATPEAARDRLVAVMFAKGWRQVVSVLAILKTGAAYVPIDPALPPMRREALLARTEALALDDEALVDAALAAARAGRPAPRLPEVTDPTRLAYVIYTSGSTGEPKGVMIEHAAAHGTVVEVNRRWTLGPEDRVLGLSSLSFDLSVFDFFGPLSVGGALVLPEASAGRDAQRWAELMVRHRVSVWNSVPALMAMLEAYGIPEGSALRLVMMSGDWVPIDLVKRLRAALPDAQLLSLGGATEAAIWSNAHEIDTLDPEWPSIPYGLPLAGQMLHVVDGRGEACPDWVTGQIEISGIGLARGYWRDPARTAERFRVTRSGERRYVTGDLGRFRPYAGASGATPIEFLGREDNQVKVQGYRIELGEIEAALAAHPDVAEAVVVVRTDSSTRARALHGFVLPRQAANAPDSAAAEALVTTGSQALRAASRSVSAAEFDAVAQRATGHAVQAAGAALRELAGPGVPLEARPLIERAGVSRRYEGWLRRMLPLVNGASATTSGGGTESIAQLDLLGFGESDFALLSAVAERLPDLLTERQHSADLYLSRQTPEVYAKLFAAPNAAIGAMLAARAAQGPVRILEVGGGLGTTLSAIAPMLSGSNVRYHFTDLSPHFVNRAREQFGGLGWVSVGTFDFDAGSPPSERYDVIVASNALHVARDVRHTLRLLRQCLAPGGVLVVLEQTRFFPWFDLGMGLQTGFDARTDLTLRPDSPLLAREQWCELLRDAGFASAQAVVEAGTISDRLGTDVILAHAGSAMEHSAGGHSERLASQLPAWLAERLPAHMVPPVIEALPQWPLSANGKVDRGRLASLAQASVSRASGVSAKNDPAHREVVAVVRELLPTTSDDPSRSLFEQGATSLTLVALHRRLAEKLGVTVPLQVLFERPTVVGLADAVRRLRAPAPAMDSTTRPATMVSFSPLAGTRPALVMLPGVLGLPLYLRGLAEALEPDVQLASIALPGVFDDATPLDRIEAQAECALLALREAQPTGPYWIAGHSYGGYVAIEMARRLRAAGEIVEHLILGDTVRTRSRLEAFQTDEVAYTALTRALHALHGAQLSRSFDDVMGEGPRGAYEATAEEVLRAGLLGPGAPSLDRMLALFKANFRALGAYRPEAFPGGLTVVRTEGGFSPEFLEYESSESIADPALGWTGLASGEIRVRTIPGDHLQMTDEANTRAFAQALRELLNGA